MAKRKINEKVLFKNVSWNIQQAAVQYEHARHVRVRARSGYYKLAILLIASVVEAIAHLLLQKHIDNGVELPTTGYECYSCHALPKSFYSDKEELVICKRRKPDFRLTTQTDFQAVNRVSLKVGLFSKRFYNKIEKVRKLRNKIHIQSLNFVDRSYTKSDLEYVSSVLSEILKKI